MMTSASDSFEKKDDVSVVPDSHPESPSPSQDTSPANESRDVNEPTESLTSSADSVRGASQHSTPSDPNETTPQPDSGVDKASGRHPNVSAPSEKISAADRVAAIVDDDDDALNQVLEEAMSGISVDDLSPASSVVCADEPNVDSLVTGRIANVGSEDLLIDFGAKSLGVMPRIELDADEIPSVGDPIEVLVTGSDAQSGLLTVSRKRARQEQLLSSLKIGMVVEGRVSGMNRGGLEVDIEGLRTFMPASQVDAHFMKDISDLIGTTIRAEVTQFDRADQNIILSRRKVQIREAEEEKEKLYTTIEVGEVRRGKVRSLADYGAFVDIGGVDGLLHISDMSWGRVKHPKDVLKVAEEIEVKIIKINREKKKISLSLKQTLPNPWESAASKYPPGTKVSGRVVRLANFGAFVEVEPGIDALLPISEMSWTRRLRHPKEAVHEGDVVEASVLSCEIEKKHMTVSLKALGTDPWAMATSRYPSGSKIKGTVVRTTDFGAFINLEEGIDGLIHISELSEKRVRAVTDVVKAGDEVDARVLSVDPEAKKIGLSLKAPPVEPSPAQIAQMQADRAATAKRQSKKRRGGLTIAWDQGLGALDPSKFSR